MYILYRGVSISHRSSMQYDTTVHATAMILHAMLTLIHSVP